MTYVNIQGMRAVAAIMVLVSHIYWPLIPMRDHWSQPYADMVGPAGVDVFFVISGFIVYTVAKRMGQSDQGGRRFSVTRDFAIRRLIRIYPIYWVVFAVVSAVMFLFPSFEPVPAFLNHKPIISQLLLIAQPNDRIQAAWTLNFEVYFYTAVTISMFLCPRSPIYGLLLWFGTIFIVTVTSFYLGKTWMFQFQFASILFEFMFGIIVAELIQRGFTRFGLTSILVGSFFFLAGAIAMRHHGGWMVLPSWWRMGCFGLPSALIIYGLVAVELRHGWQFAHPWKYLGDASYSMYLWHQPLFAAMAALCAYAGLFQKVPRELLAIGFAAAGVGVGLASYRYIEQPILRFLGMRVSKRLVKSRPDVAVSA